MRIENSISLAPYTTLNVGGVADEFISVTSEVELLEATREADAQHQPLFFLAGGSNVVISDAGFSGRVIHIQTTGVIEERVSSSEVRLLVQAGHLWSDLVSQSLEQGYAGLECLAGIPGCTGATPIQNVGAYGQEVANLIERVRVFDRQTATVSELLASQCQFAYRSSIFRENSHYVVLAVTLRLKIQQQTLHPVLYQQLADRLDLQIGQHADAHDVAEAVLTLRREKGMVVDKDDPASVSVGSFFKNPVLSEHAFASLKEKVAWLKIDSSIPVWLQDDTKFKVSAAWLIEQAGFRCGYQLGRAGISPKHTLALINCGGASAADIVALARQIAFQVKQTFGVSLLPEPVFVSHTWKNA